MKKVAFSGFLLTGLASIIFSGCSCTDPNRPSSNKKNDELLEKDEIAYVDVKIPASKITEARAEIRPIQQNSVKGIVTFTAVEGGIKVVANLEGLKSGAHGFHIHEFGDCGGEGAAATGPHFNPTKKKHGGPDSAERHVGDLGNIVADDTGYAHYERIDKFIAFEGPHSILGRSIVVHADPDDFVSQPSGNSGAKIGCGLIETVELN